MPPMIRALLIANVAVFFLAPFFGPAFFGTFALWPLGSGLFMPWQVLSYGFLHAGLAHLAFNMFGLWMFGAELERVWGSRRLGIFFAISVLVAALAQLLVTAWMGSNAPTVGASGGLFGLLIGFAMVFPTRKVFLLFLPIPLAAPVFVAFYGLIELALGVTGSASGVAHFAHLGGLLGGWLTIRYWRGQMPFGSRR